MCTPIYTRSVFFVQSPVILKYVDRDVYIWCQKKPIGVKIDLYIHAYIYTPRLFRAEPGDSEICPWRPVHLMSKETYRCENRPMYTRIYIHASCNKFYRYTYIYTYIYTHIYTYITRLVFFAPNQAWFEVSHSYTRHDLFIHMTLLMHRHDPFIYTTWPIHTQDITHSQTWCMTPAYTRHDSFIHTSSLFLSPPPLPRPHSPLYYPHIYIQSLKILFHLSGSQLMSNMVCCSALQCVAVDE